MTNKSGEGSVVVPLDQRAKTAEPVNVYAILADAETPLRELAGMHNLMRIVSEHHDCDEFSSRAIEAAVGACETLHAKIEGIWEAATAAAHADWLKKN